MKARQAVLVEPFKVEIRDADLPDPAASQILVECEASAISAGTELAVYPLMRAVVVPPIARSSKAKRFRLMRSPWLSNRRACSRPTCSMSTPTAPARG